MKVYGVKGMAKEFKRSTKTIKRWIASGKIKPRRLDDTGSYYFTENEINAHNIILEKERRLKSEKDRLKQKLQEVRRLEREKGVYN